MVKALVNKRPCSSSKGASDRYYNASRWVFRGSTRQSNGPDHRGAYLASGSLKDRTEYMSKDQGQYLPFNGNLGVVQTVILGIFLVPTVVF